MNWAKRMRIGSLEGTKNCENKMRENCCYLRERKFKEHADDKINVTQKLEVIFKSLPSQGSISNRERAAVAVYRNM